MPLKRSWRQTLAVSAAILALAAAVSILLGCPLRLLFGVSCPLCGMGRACLCAVRLDFAAAFRFHPLWPLVIPGLTVWAACERRTPGRGRPVWLTLLLIFAVVFAVRLVRQDPVVWPEPASGLLTGLFYKK